MRKTPALLLVALMPAVAEAAELELAGYGGYSFPFYSQTLRYDPGPINVPIPGVSIDQGGQFDMESSGGAVFAGGLTFYPTDGFGFEVRLDSADISVDTALSVYRVDVTLPAPNDPVQESLSLDRGEASLKAPTPWSFNLKLRSGGRALRFTASAGASRLGNLEFNLDQTVAIGVVAVNLETSELEIATVPLRATTLGESRSSWGGNLGLGFQIGIGERGALIVEGRAFYFPARTIEWEPVLDQSLPPLQEQLLERTLESLDPVELKPWWAQLTVGIAIRF
jgi:hypothetical protein